MLFHNKKRLILSIGAMAFSVLIMFMELGFFNGGNDSQSKLALMFDADLIMMHRNFTNLYAYRKMNRVRLNQAFMFDEIIEVVPINQDNVSLKNPKTKLTKRIAMLTFPPDSAPLKIPMYDQAKEILKKQGTILFDKKSRKIFGNIAKGQLVEIDERLYRVGGFFEMGPNFVNDGNILMSDASWNSSNRKMEHISYGLIRTRPGTDIQALKQKIIDRYPDDIIVLTPDEVRRREVIFIITTVPLSAIFGVGLVVGFIIGVIVCFQILYNEIMDHMPQYATLRAMGFSDHYLKSVVIQKALWLSIFGFIPGLLGGYLLYAAVEYYTALWMFLTFGRIATIFILTILMCLVGGLIAMKTLTVADPAELY